MSNHLLPVVIGTYAKPMQSTNNENGLKKYQWICAVSFLACSADGIRDVIDRVEFQLHKSFKNV
jgi:hypothetical protein